MKTNNLDMNNSPTNVCILNVFGANNRGDAAIFVSLVKVVEESFARHQQKTKISALARYTSGMDWSPLLHDVHFFEPLFASYYRSRWLRRLFSVYIIAFTLIWLLGLHKISLSLLPKRKRDAFRAIEDADHVLSCGGAFIDDSSPSFILNLLEIQVALSMGKPVVLVSQSIGPFQNAWARRFAAKILQKVDYILPRETWTEHYVVEQLNIDRKRVHLVPDLAFDSPGLPKEEAAELLHSAGIDTDKHLVGMTVLNWVYPGSKNALLMHKRYTEAMAKLCDYIIREYDADVVLIPQYVRGPEKSKDDMDVANEVSNLVIQQDRLHLMSRDYTPDAVKGMIGCMTVFVGSRMHSNIFALSQAIPAMAISYLPKTTYIMDGLQLSEYVIDISEVSMERLQPVFDKLWQNRIHLKEYLNNTIPAFQQRIIDTLDILFEDAETTDLAHSQDEVGSK